MDNYFTMLVGIAGSGKSTMAKKLQQDKEDTVILSSDEIRKELYGSEEIQDNPQRVFSIMNARTIKLLKNGKSVIYDATNLNAKNRINILKEAKQYCAYTTCIFIDCTIDRSLKQQQNRPRKVDERILQKQLKYMSIPSKDEGWDYIIYS